MKQKLILALMLVGCLTTAIDAVKAQTQRQLFDFGWQFTKIVNGKSSNSKLVDLPHDWDIYEGPNSGKGATGTGGGWFEAGKGEYRKQFTIDNSPLDQRSLATGGTQEE